MLKLPRQPILWAVSLGHMTNDMFMSMGPVLLVFISATIMPISAAQIGVMISARQVVGAISQPYFGYLSDRSGGRLLGAGGVFWTVTMLSLSLALAFSGEFWLMAIPFAMSALGSGAFHPVGAMYAADSDKLNAASNTAIFFLFGQVGLALGPAIAGILLNNAASNGIFDFVTEQATVPVSPLQSIAISGANVATMLPIFIVAGVVIPASLFMSGTIPRARDLPPRPQPSPDDAPTEPLITRLARIVTVPLLIMMALVFLKSVAQLGAVAFIPVMFERRGWSPAEYGVITSLFWMASAIMGIYLGRVADRTDPRIVIAVSTALGAAALFLLPNSVGAASFGLAIATGAFLGGTHSIIVVIAQRLIPAGKGFASGVILGYIFVSGALSTFLFGIIADGPESLSGAITVDGGIGLAATFQLVAVGALIAAGLAFALPSTVARPAPPQVLVDVDREPEIVPSPSIGR